LGLDEVLSTGGLAFLRSNTGRVALVVIGVDAHKRTHTASAVEGATGRAQGDVTVSADGDGHLRLLDFVRGHGEQRIWAVEDCRHVSGALERFLLGAGETVIRVRRT
jgi:hypothetical protein